MRRDELDGEIWTYGTLYASGFRSVHGGVYTNEGGIVSSWRCSCPWTGALLTAEGSPAEAVSVFEPTAKARKYTLTIGGTEESR